MFHVVKLELTTLQIDLLLVELDNGQIPIDILIVTELISFPGNIYNFPLSLVEPIK